MTAPSAELAYRVLHEIAAERAMQDAKWGEQNHPDGTATNWVDQIRPAFGWDSTMSEAEHTARLARHDCQRAARRGEATWLKILREELAEAFAESDAVKLRAELIQVAAVAVAWVEAIDRRHVVSYGTGCHCNYQGEGTPEHAPSPLCQSLRPDAGRTEGGAS